jgi:hypothetical protein
MMMLPLSQNHTAFGCVIFYIQKINSKKVDGEEVPL